MSSNVPFTSYDKNTGEIISSGYCPRKFLKMQGDNILEELWDDSLYYIDTSTKTGVLKPQKPEGAWVFDYNTKTWVPDPQTQWNLIRELRNNLLAQSDWTQLPDVPLTTKELWASYRQALRDVTSQSDPYNITWPQPPA